MAFGKGHHLALIDGSAYIFRAYHALPPLTRKSDGMPLGAVSGFVSMLLKLIEDSRSDAPTHVAVVFDKSEVTFRNDIYADYKAHRPPAPEDLIPQFPLVRDAARAMNLAVLEQPGYEADDIIGALACKARDAGGRVTIVSSDKDLMQLVSPGIDMLDPIKNKRIGRDEVFEKFGVWPDRVVDVQALAGDPVDNVPGAPGIGIKTAALLINEYGDLETLLARAGEIKQPKRRETLLENAEQIRISKRLVTLDCDMPVEAGLDELEVREPDPEVLLPFLAAMEFRAIARRVAERLGVAAPPIADATPEGSSPAAPAQAVEVAPIAATEVEVIADMAGLQRWIERIRWRGRVALAAETFGGDEMRSEIAGFGLCVEAGRAAYLPLGHKEGASADLFASAALAPGQVPLAEALAALKPLLETLGILKIGHDTKALAKLLSRHGVEMTGHDDTLLMSFAMNSGLHAHGLDGLSERYLLHVPRGRKALTGSGRAAVGLDRVPAADLAKVAGETAEIVFRLWELFRPQLGKTRVATVYETLERPLVPVMKQMEMWGITVDRDQLSRMSNAFAQKMAGLEDEIYQLAGEKFNVGSPKQLGEILFDKLGMAGGKTGKTGAYTTDATILEDLAAEGHDLPARILDWRQVSKLKSTYTDSLQTHINPETGRVHTVYSIAGANTGRLASNEPNLQNIPVRTEEGRRIREAFVAAPGTRLVSLDYSQIELRILAHVAGIPELKQAFREGQDIHALTASEMFGVPMAEMTKDIRARAKAINFGVIYGISGFGLARNLRIPRADAQGFIDRYFERFPGIRAYMDDTIAFAQRNHFVQTIFGRKIHTPEINARGPTAAFAKRASINAPIQGAAADVIRRAMVRVPAAIEGLRAKMLLSVHDELLFEVDEADVDRVIPRVKEVMEGAAMPAVKLDVPLEVDAGVGASWAAAH
jgi:DNA polymerase-1